MQPQRGNREGLRNVELQHLTKQVSTMVVPGMLQAQDFEDPSRLPARREGPARYIIARTRKGHGKHAAAAGLGTMSRRNPRHVSSPSWREAVLLLVCACTCVEQRPRVRKDSVYQLCCGRVPRERIASHASASIGKVP